MKNNSMTNTAFLSAREEVSTFNINTQAAVLDCDPYEFLDNLDQKITSSPQKRAARRLTSYPLSLN